MAFLRCKICGEIFEVNDTSAGFCCKCGAKQTFPNVTDNRQSEMFSKAHELRIGGDFEKAMGICEFIISELPSDAESYWTALLCRYGVIYKKDASSGKIKISVTRPQNSTVFNDSDYKKAIFYADDIQKTVYMTEARIIDEEQKKALFGNNETVKPTPKPVNNSGNVSDEKKTSIPEAVPALRRAYIFLEDGNWTNANIYFEMVLDREPENGEAYLGKLMTEKKVRRKELLKNCSQPFDGNDNYRKLVRFGERSLVDEISGYNLFIKERNENNRLEKIYNEGMALLGDAKNEKDCLKAAEKFRSVAHFRDSAELEKQCRWKIEQIKCDEKYNKATALMHRKKEDSVSEAAQIFESIKDYKDSAEKTEECLKLIEELKLLDEHKKKAYDRTLKGIKKVCSVITAVIVVLSLFSIFVFSFGIPFMKYKKAEKVFSSGNMADTLEILDSLGGFLDSEEKLDELIDRYCIKEKSEAPAYLMEDGTVFYSNGKEDKELDFCTWENITEVACDEFIAGLSENGYVFVSVKYKGSGVELPDTSHWSDIVDISVDYKHIVGLDKNGEVYAETKDDYEESACDTVQYWYDIVEISTGCYHTVGLQKDGTVVATSDYSLNKYQDYGQCAVNYWENIVAVAAGGYHTVGLKSDGTVVACGENEELQCNVSGWRNIVAIAAGYDYTVGLSADGSIFVAGDIEDVSWDELIIEKHYRSEAEIPETEEEIIYEEETSLAEETTMAE